MNCVPKPRFAECKCKNNKASWQIQHDIFLPQVFLDLLESLSTLTVHASKFSTSALRHHHHYDNGCDAKDCGGRIHMRKFLNHQQSFLFNLGNNLEEQDYHKFTGISGKVCTFFMVIIDLIINSSPQASSKCAHCYMEDFFFSGDNNFNKWKISRKRQSFGKLLKFIPQEHHNYVMNSDSTSFLADFLRPL